MRAFAFSQRSVAGAALNSFPYSDYRHTALHTKSMATQTPFFFISGLPLHISSF